MYRLLFGLVLLVATQAGNGAYITDKLLAGYYAAPDLTDTPLRALPAGTPMEVLEEKGKLSRVRLGDNSEGWVETRFISHEKPAKTMLLELQVKYTLLKRQLDEGEGELGSDGAAPSSDDMQAISASDISRRETPDGQKRGEPTDEDKTVQQLRQENALLRERLLRMREPSPDETSIEEYRNGNIQPWIIPLLLLGLLLSFVAGVAFKNYRIAKRAARKNGSIT